MNNKCNEPFCKREGDLVQQFVFSDVDELHVFRWYLCRWHRGSCNRYRLKHQSKSVIINHIQDEILFKEYNKKRLTTRTYGG